MPESNPGLAEIVGGHFNVDLVADADANEILSHFAGDMGEDLVAVGQSDTEHGAREYLRHGAGQLNWFFLRHAVSSPRGNYFMLVASDFKSNLVGPVLAIKAPRDNNANLRNQASSQAGQTGDFVLHLTQKRW
jgi:hypothetical protein